MNEGSERAVAKLPRGRHRLTREEVEQSQRERLLLAMADAMSEKGFARTSVEDVIKRAGVSRESFYRLFSSKLDCFMAALDQAATVLLARVGAGLGLAGTPVDQFERVMNSYLEALIAEPAYARLFLIEVNAAGPEAIQRRLTVQTRFSDALAGLLGAGNEDGRFACQVIVAAVSAMLAGPLAERDYDAVRALGPRITRHVRLLWTAGFFAAEGN